MQEKERVPILSRCPRLGNDARDSKRRVASVRSSYGRQMSGQSRLLELVCMAKEDEQEEGDDDEVAEVMANGSPRRDNAKSEDTDTEEEEEEEEEPRLKYAHFTKALAPVYRNGDATSAFMVAGDKMVLGVILKEGTVLIGGI